MPKVLREYIDPLGLPNLRQVCMGQHKATIRRLLAALNIMNFSMILILQEAFKGYRKFMRKGISINLLEPWLLLLLMLPPSNLQYYFRSNGKDSFEWA